MVCGQVDSANAAPTGMMESVPVQNFEFETFFSAGQPATLDTNKWVHFGTEVGAGNNGNTDLAGFCVAESVLKQQVCALFF